MYERTKTYRHYFYVELSKKLYGSEALKFTILNSMTESHANALILPRHFNQSIITTRVVSQLRKRNPRDKQSLYFSAQRTHIICAQKYFSIWDSTFLQLKYLINQFVFSLDLSPPHTISFEWTIKIVWDIFCYFSSPIKWNWGMLKSSLLSCCFLPIVGKSLKSSISILWDHLFIWSFCSCNCNLSYKDKRIKGSIAIGQKFKY